MSPNLVRWDKQYRKKGLTIIDVNNGDADTKKDLEAYVKKNGKRYATLWDKDKAVCSQYAVKGFPAAFLIGVDGNVIWEGFPVPELETVEKLIEQELAKVKSGKSKRTGSKTDDEPKPKPVKTERKPSK